MESTEISSGDFLKDLEVILIIRSSGTDLKILQKIGRAHV